MTLTAGGQGRSRRIYAAGGIFFLAAPGLALA